MSLSLLLFWYDLYHFPFSLKHITMEICDPHSLYSAYFYTLSLSPPFACSIQVRSNLSWVFSMLYSFAPSSYFHKAFTLFWEAKGPLGFYVFQLNTLQRWRGVDREVGGYAERGIGQTLAVSKLPLRVAVQVEQRRLFSLSACCWLWFRLPWLYRRRA